MICLACARFGEFGCFTPSRFSHSHYNAMQKTIKAHKNLQTIQQNEHIPKINITWLCKDFKISDLQTHAQLAQQDKTLDQVITRSNDSNLHSQRNSRTGRNRPPGYYRPLEDGRTTNPKDTVGKRAVRILLECFLVRIKPRVVIHNRSQDLTGAIPLFQFCPEAVNGRNSLLEHSCQRDFFSSARNRWLLRRRRLCESHF